SDLVAVTGSRPSEPVLVAAAWLVAHTGDLADVVACDPATGARLDPRERHSTESYRPGTGLVALVRARDGRCRFPGCSVAARFCDLDHVRPWPAGPTEASNLMCLCRRHHRIKQAPGWRVRLHADGRADWTDPAGRVTVTAPVDALETLVLHPDPNAEVAAPVRRVGEPEPAELPSAFEDALDHHAQQLEARTAARREHRHRRERQRAGDRDRWDRASSRVVRIDRHPWRDARGRPVTLGPWVLDGHDDRHRRRAPAPEPPF
ncbi:MAG TPA: HNH endonuclease signature motif containing protein, partial [Phycicoccus sp.]|nr:HNH endonuclease signature motif containing protein [Phycicoccus sp.]